MSSHLFTGLLYTSQDLRPSRLLAQVRNVAMLMGEFSGPQRLANIVELVSKSMVASLSLKVSSAMIFRIFGKKPWVG